jgi:hypothetical protein
MDPAGMSLSETGYYERPVAGRASLYIKWKKSVTNPSANQPAEYILQKTLMVINNNKVTRIINKKSFLDALDDRRDEVKTFMKKHRISGRHSADQDIASVFRYYNSLF